MTRPILSAVTTCALILAALAGPAAAQKPNSVRSEHGAWSIVCDTPAGATNEQCVLMQNVISASHPEISLSIVVLRTADGKADILRVLTPLGVLLPQRLGLYVDKKDMGSVQYTRCFADGCYAESILDGPLLDQMRNGAQAIFTIFEQRDQGTGVEVDLKGFGEGFDALPH